MAFSIPRISRNPQTDRSGTQVGTVVASMSVPQTQRRSLLHWTWAAVAALSLGGLVTDAAAQGRSTTQSAPKFKVVTLSLIHI